MEDKKNRKRNAKLFLGGAAIATVVMLGYRKYELIKIGKGFAKIVTTPELLADFQALVRLVITKK